MRFATREDAGLIVAMKLSLALCCAALLTAVHVHAADEAPAPEKKLMHRLMHPFGGDRAKKAAPASTPAPAEKKPGIVHRVLHPFGGGKGGKMKNSGKLSVEMKLSPLPLKLAETNRLKVTLTLANHGKKLAPLEFPTSQRIEVLVKNSAGKTVEQWSQDQAFTSEPTVVTINPGERAEYSVEVATRDLSAGQSYTVRGFFPKYEELKAEKMLVPEK